MLILASTVTGCVSISVFALLVWLTVDITSFAVELKAFVITAVIKRYKSIVKKKKKTHDKIVLLGKLDSIEF